MCLHGKLKHEHLGLEDLFRVVMELKCEDSTMTTQSKQIQMWD